MKRAICGGLLAVACTAGASATAGNVYDDTGSFYISPMGQYDLLDKNRDARDDFGYQVGVGKNFSPNWAGEIDVNNGSFKVPHSGVSQKLMGYSLDVLYKFGPDSMFRPYLLAGAGLIEDKIGGNGTNTFYLAEAGAGFLTGIGSQAGATRVQLRTEAKYRVEFAGPNAFRPRDPGDLIFGVGLQFSFGNPTPPPPKPAAVLPPEPLPPPPPPAPPEPLDSDGDGVPDSMDKCPNTPKGDKVDAFGCTIKDEIKLQGVNFATDSAELVPESHYVLDYGVATLKKYPQLVIEVHGHTDNTGSVKHNLLLSQRRAESVMKYLQDHGVTNTMTAKGYGKEHPIADNSTADGRLENRRVSLHIVSGF